MGIAPKNDDQYTEKEAQDRFEAALRGGLKTPHKPLKDKPKVEKTANFKSVRIPGSVTPSPKRGRKPKGQRALTGAESSAKSRSELKPTGFGSTIEQIRDAKLAPTTMDVKKPRKAKKKPGK
jgi:hypothetical protein